MYLYSRYYDTTIIIYGLLELNLFVRLGIVHLKTPHLRLSFLLTDLVSVIMWCTHIHGLKFLARIGPELEIEHDRDNMNVILSHKLLLLSELCTLNKNLCYFVVIQLNARPHQINFVIWFRNRSLVLSSRWKSEKYNLAERHFVIYMRNDTIQFILHTDTITHSSVLIEENRLA